MKKLSPNDLQSFPGIRGESFYTLYIMNQNRQLHIRISDSIINSNLTGTIVHLHRTLNGNLCFEKITNGEQLEQILDRWTQIQQSTEALSTKVTFWLDDKQSTMLLDNTEVIATHCLSNQGFTRIYTYGDYELKRVLGRKVYNIAWDKILGTYTISGLDGREISTIKVSKSGSLRVLTRNPNGLNSFNTMKSLFSFSYNKIDKQMENKLVKALEYVKERCRLCLRNLFGCNLMRISIAFKVNATDQIEFQVFNEIIITSPKNPLILPVPSYNKLCIRQEGSKRPVRGNAVEEIRKLKEKMKKLLYNRERYKSMINMNVTHDLHIKKDMKKDHIRCKSLFELADDELTRSVSLLDSYTSIVNTSNQSTSQFL